MNKYGYVNVASAVPIIKVADCKYNTEQIIKLIDDAADKAVEVLVFPELCICGYTCADLFHQTLLLEECMEQLKYITSYTKNTDMLIVVGAPIRCDNQLFNCAVMINKGKILGIVPKTYLPNYNEFYEKRWFSSANTLVNDYVMIDDEEIPFGCDLLFQHDTNKELKIGIEICEDLWVPIPPSSFAAINGATLILNPSASNDLVGKSDYRRSLVSQQSARCMAGYVYTSAGFGESSTDVVFGGHCLICENGALIEESKKFKLTSTLLTSTIDIQRLVNERSKATGFNEPFMGIDYNTIEYRTISFSTYINTDNTITRKVNPHPFVPNDIARRNTRCREIFHIQTNGLAKRLSHTGIDTVVLGISGGLDSTLALLVCIETFDKLNLDRKNIVGITMPGFGTTDRTYTNALVLMKELGITMKEIPIRDASIQHFKDIDHDINTHNITYENVQARERTQILMDYSNKVNGLVVGTGDLSELALGWATYNGDHMSMYAVNTSIPKTLVRYIIQWVADSEDNTTTKETLYDVLDTPVSPELLPPDKQGKIKQKTEDVVGPYELHDFYLYYLLRFGYSPKKIYYLAVNSFEGKYDEETIYKWLHTFYRRFFSQQFKRSCLPDGPKVGSICLSPRGDLRMPSDASSRIWLDELEQLK